MNEVEQTALLLRQMAALRRAGRPHDEALRLARQGLPAGGLADRVDAALAALAADAVPPGRDFLDVVLASPDAPPDGLEFAADGLDAQLAAVGARSLLRLYGSVLLAAPLLAGCVLGWAHVDSVFTEDPGAAFGLGQTGAITWVLAARLTIGLKYAGIPLAVLAVVAVRVATGWIAPGADSLRRASALLLGAAAGDVAPELLVHPGERRYFEVRRVQAGERGAAAEIAVELRRTTEHRLTLFRHLAPLVLAVLFVGLAWPTLVLVVWPILRLGGSMGAF